MSHALGGAAALGVIVVLVTVPVYVWVEPSWRALVGRLAAAFIVGVAFLRLRYALGQRIETGPASALDAARARRRAEAAVPYHFRDLVTDVRAGVRNRRDFEQVLWPRLQALAGRPLERPALRWGRGPSLADLRRVVETIEKQP